MYILLMGAPGAGKGTQAVRLAEQFGIPHLATGDIFRAAVREGSELGKKAKACMDAGHLVPDDLTVGVVRERLAKDDCAKGFILDGFPRTLEQAKALDSIMAGHGRKLTAVLDISVPASILVERAVGRRVCRQCGATYHTKHKPTKVAGVCDECGGSTYQRADDNEATMHNRIKVYETQTKPLIEYYTRQGLYKRVDGNQAMEQVWDDTLASLK